MQQHVSKGLCQQFARLMQVLARSSPTDKFNLVKLLKKQGEIVAVTGEDSDLPYKAQHAQQVLCFMTS